MIKSVAVLLAAATLSIAATARANGPESGGTPGVTVSVTPSDGLAASQNVSVTGTGFTPNSLLTIEQCALGIEPQPCVQAGTVVANASGGLAATTMTANRTFTTFPSTATIDCLSASCVVQVTDVLARFARHHLSFSGPPAVSTSAATDVTTVAAVLNGAVNPHGAATDAWFEYSTDPTLIGAVATAAQPIGDGTVAVAVTQALSGLMPATTYYARAAGSRAGVVARGPVVSFTTVPAPGAGTGPGTGLGPGTGVPDTAPVLSALTLTPATFAAARSGGSTARRGGVLVRYRLSEPAGVRFTVQRALPGVRRSGACRARRASDRGARRCTRFVAVRGSFSQTGRAGDNRVRFSGRLAGRALKVGRHRLTVLATDAGGRRSIAVRAGFRIRARR